MILNFLRSQFIEIIEWIDETRNTLVWKFPDQDREIKMGAQLIVRDSQQALFINEGQIADVYAPGRYELVTRNMPILSRLRGWKYGFNSPFKVDIYYVATREFSNLKWGTLQPIMVSDPDLSLVPLRAFGSFNMQISDPPTFFKSFAGTDPVVTVEEFLEGFRSTVVTEFSNAIKRSGTSLIEINQQTAELGAKLLPLLQSEFDRFGLKITRFNIENVSLPEDIQKALVEQDLELRKLRKKVQAAQETPDMQKFMQFQAAQGLEKEGGASLARSAMELGLGMQMSQQITSPSKEETLNLLKQLAELKNAGILSEEEFEAKKKELLSRL